MREISRQLGIDRKTVTRLVNAYESTVKANLETGIDEFLATSPKYKSRLGVARVVHGSISREIDMLTDYSGKFLINTSSLRSR